MTGSLHERYGTYYAVLSYKDKNKKYKNKWIPTGYEVKGNKTKAKTKLDQFISQYKHLEYTETDGNRILFTTAIQQWLLERQGKVERSTYEGDEIYVNKHIIPYFEQKNLYLEDITPRHIKEYYEYKFRGGRLDNKEGGLNVQSIKKHSAILKQVFTDALISERITRNPAANVPLPKRDKQQTPRKGVYLTGRTESCTDWII